MSERLPGSLDERDTRQDATPVNPRVPQWFVTRFDEARREGFPAVCIECGHGVQEDGSGDHFDGCKLGARPAGCAETDSAAIRAVLEDVPQMLEPIDRGGRLLRKPQVVAALAALDRLLARLAAEEARADEAERVIEAAAGTPALALARRADTAERERDDWKRWNEELNLPNIHAVVAEKAEWGGRAEAAEARAAELEAALREIAESNTTRAEYLQEIARKALASPNPRSLEDGEL